MNGLEALEAMSASLNDLADWAEDALAGGKPAKWVVQQESERTRQIAFMAELAGRGRMTPAALAGILRGDQGDGETVTLGRPGLKPPEHCARHPVRSVRQWLDRAWARLWLSS